MFLTLKWRRTWTSPVKLFPSIPRPPFLKDLGEPSGPRVLLALDNIAISRMLKQYLEWTGVSVTITLNAEETLKVALSRSIDLVIYSIALSTDPLALLTGIRERGGKMPVITIVEKDFNSHEDYIRQGVNDIIKKPLEIAELQRKIEQQLNKS
ncbi:response regulator [Chitinophaga ginsengisoli]|uniref:Response regulator receiver domain-containing protein n=1 Tax=Chitinophaga ginsengisoli TaxID=363837 RepID=A0A2P8GCL6_9BACT|nr:response regulator [Chitinophaga ginsengisoli]PSL31724.1 response regulator receiver domain-containing protein [Chitinophaga ginsengisoli]